MHVLEGLRRVSCLLLCGLTLVLKFPSASPVALCCAVEPCSALTAEALLTTNWDLSRGTVSTETSASLTLKWPSHSPAVWSVWHIWQEKTAETGASCPVQSETDISSNRAVNDISGSQPVRVTHICDDGRFYRIYSIFMQSVCENVHKKKKKNSVKKLDRGESVYTPFTLILVALLAIYREQMDRSCSLI